jgi:hypothetical protein
MGNLLFRISAILKKCLLSYDSQNQRGCNLVVVASRALHFDINIQTHGGVRTRKEHDSNHLGLCTALPQTV